MENTLNTIVEYSSVYCTTHDVIVTSRMPEFSSSKILNHRFLVGNNKGKSVIDYEMIIGRDLMVQLGLTDRFNLQGLQWYGATVHIKEPSGLLGKSYLNKYNMLKVIMQTAERYSTREATE